jgi:hypothetical protein
MLATIKLSARRASERADRGHGGSAGERNNICGRCEPILGVCGGKTPSIGSHRPQILFQKMVDACMLFCGFTGMCANLSKCRWLKTVERE